MKSHAMHSRSSYRPSCSTVSRPGRPLTTSPSWMKSAGTCWPAPGAAPRRRARARGSSCAPWPTVTPSARAAVRPSRSSPATSAPRSASASLGSLMGTLFHLAGDRRNPRPTDRPPDCTSSHSSPLSHTPSRVTVDDRSRGVPTGPLGTRVPRGTTKGVLAMTPNPRPATSITPHPPPAVASRAGHRPARRARPAAGRRPAEAARRRPPRRRRIVDHTVRARRDRDRPGRPLPRLDRRADLAATTSAARRRAPGRPAPRDPGRGRRARPQHRTRAAGPRRPTAPSPAARRAAPRTGACADPGTRHGAPRGGRRPPRRHGVDPQLALAVSWQESGWQMDRRSDAGAIGAMQVLPRHRRAGCRCTPGAGCTCTGWRDNATAGVQLLRRARRRDPARGATGRRRTTRASGAVREHGLYRRHQGLRRQRARDPAAGSRRAGRRPEPAAGPEGAPRHAGDASSAAPAAARPYDWGPGSFPDRAAGGSRAARRGTPARAATPPLATP